nr:MAG TPA: hypothetical protein [Crassvirales sp.]
MVNGLEILILVSYVIIMKKLRNTLNFWTR